MKSNQEKAVKIAKTRLKAGDEVVVITGKDKGKRGTIKQVSRTEAGVKVKVEGIGMVKKHVRPNPQANQQGGIVAMEAFVDASNVMIYNGAAQKGSRIGVKIKDGRKVRCFKSGGELTEIDA